MGLGMQLTGLAGRILLRTGAPGLSGRSLRQSRHGPVDENAAARAVQGDGACLRAPLFGCRFGRAMASRYGARRSRTHGCARHRSRACRRRFDGRHDRSTRRGRLSGTSQDLVSLMSTSGKATLPGPSPRVLRGLLRRRARRNSERGIAETIAFLRLIGSQGTRPATLSFGPRSSVRSSGALIRTAGPGISSPFRRRSSRVRALRRIRAPTLVMHGADDPLIRVAAGQDTAANIHGARLRVIPGWGHDLPTTLLRSSSPNRDYCEIGRAIASPVDCGGAKRTRATPRCSEPLIGSASGSSDGPSRARMMIRPLKNWT